MTVPTGSPIRRLLIANRAEIASRIMGTAHRLGIECVAVYSTADQTAPYVAQADLAVHLDGVASSQTYLNIPVLLDAARRSGADAVHPGYGFLSENPDFAQAVIDAGFTWVGPSPASIRAMALKVQAKSIAAAAGVRLVPGALLPADLDEAGLAEVGADIGYPLIIKASAGGGGKGMRIVAEPSAFGEAAAAARREAASAFGDDTVFAERYLSGARHVEVQVFGDLHGNLVHCFERECSVQRRHQKVIEEAPSPGITEVTRAGLFEAATALARTIDYVGAGTVEFAVIGSGSAQEFYFLEMNTRLQVEHPVTEAITGIDLVAWQLAVAQGQPLPLVQQQITIRGHAIQARIYAEDPARGFLPVAGRVTCFDGTDQIDGFDRFDDFDEGVRIDTGVAAGSVVTSHYDPMLAKVIAHGDTRDQARARLAMSLKGMRIHGTGTNRECLVAVLEHPVFTAGAATTSFLQEHPQVFDPQPDRAALDRHVLAATCAWAEAMSRQGVSAGMDVPPAWRNVPAVPQFRCWQRTGDVQFTTVRFVPTTSGLQVDLLRTEQPPRAALFTDGGRPLIQPWARVDGQSSRGQRLVTVVDVRIDGVSARHEVCAPVDVDGIVYVDDGLVSSSWLPVPVFAGGRVNEAVHHPVTPVPGTITSVPVRAGEVVQEGQTLVLLEAMKMEHRIRAAGPGRIARVLVAVGDAVDAHQVVVELDLESTPEVGDDGELEDVSR